MVIRSKSFSWLFGRGPHFQDEAVRYEIECGEKKVIWHPGEPLPWSEEAIIDPAKFENYSLSPDNPGNQGKWIAFEQLGYDVHTSERRRVATADLIQQIRVYLSQAPVTGRESTPYGERFSVSIPIRGPNGRKATLSTIWQIDTDAIYPRLITNWAEVHDSDIIDP